MRLTHVKSNHLMNVFSVGSSPVSRALARLMIVLLFTQTIVPVALASIRGSAPTASLKKQASKETRSERTDAGKDALAPAQPLSTQDSGTWGVELKRVSIEFNNFIGIDHHQPSNKIVLSVNSPSGQPNNFSSVAPGGTHNNFSNVAGWTGEIKLATARDDGQGMSFGGFRTGDVFTGTGAPGIIARISPDGVSVQNPWVTLPGETTPLQGGLYVDRTGVFGGDLIAVTTEGRVWRVTASGVPSLVASLGVTLAGVTTIPNDPAKYGPWAGKILAGAPEQGTIYAIDAQGNASPYQLGINPQDIDLITAHENFYGVDSGDRTLWGAPAEAFAGIIGDILLTQASPGTLSSVHWDGTSFQVSEIAQAAQWKQVTFSPAGVAEIPAVRQVYDSIAVVRHAPTISSGRIEGALWQLSAEGFTLGGNDIITSDLLLPGTPTVAISDHPTYQGTIQGTGDPQPAGYTVTLTGNASLRHIITRTDPIQLETVAAPPTPSGTRDVSLSKANESAGDFATLRNLTLSGKAGAVIVPPGTYGNFNASAHTSFVFGVANSTETTIYNLQELTLSGASELRLAGPVVLNVKGSVSLTGSTIGAANNPRQLTLKIAEGGVTASGNSVLYGIVRAPQGLVTINGNSRVRGTLSCDRLALSGNGVLQITENDIPQPPINRYPTVNAGPDQTITLPINTINLNGTAEDDGLPAGSVLTTGWKMVSGPGNVSFSNPTNPITTATFSAAGVYVLRLAASDSLLTSRDLVTITVEPGNQPPSVEAGADQTITLPDPVNLAGTVTDDALPAGIIVSTTWRKVSGPGTVTFGNVNAALTTASFSEPGTYRLELTANDTEFTASDEITIVVNPANQPPSVDAGADQTTTASTGSNHSIYVMTSDGGHQTRLTFGGADEASSNWSPDGSKLTFTSARSGSRQIYVMDADGNRQMRLTYSGADDISPYWSPDGTKIIFSSNRDGYYDLYVMDADGSSATKLTNDPAIEYDARWQPLGAASPQANGTKIAFLRYQNNNYDIYTMDVDGSHQTRLTTSPATDDTPIWSPDGLKIAFHSNRDGNREIYTMNADGSNQSRLTNHPASDWCNDWSPDGTKIVGVSDRFGDYEIFVTNVADGAQTRLTNNPASDYRPYWSPDGTQIIFSSNRQGVFLQGTVSDDGLPVGSNVTVSWSKVSGPGIITLSAPNSISTQATFTQAGTYVLRLTASDSQLSGSDDVTVIVNPPPANQAPSVSAGPDQAISLSNILGLKGQVSDDGLPVNTGVSALWSKVSGPGTVTFNNPNAPLTTASFSASGTYVLRLTASDSQLSASDDVTITVSALNQAPTVNAGADQMITLPGAAQLSGTVTDDGLPTGSSVSTVWSMVSGPGTVAFSNPNATVTAASFSVAGTYALRLTATDSELTSSSDLVVTVNAAPCLPLPSGAVGWWTGDNNAVNFIDGNQGVLRGGAQFAPAMVEQGFKLDGVDDYVEIADQASLKPARVTTEAWVRFDGLDSQVSGAPQGFQYIVFKKNTRTDRFEGYALFKYRVGSADKFGFAVSAAQGTQAVTTSQTSVVTGQFYHVAGTYDGSRVKLYVNGALEAEIAASFPLNYGSRPVFIGATNEPGWDGKLKGTIDEAAIFDRALSASEIQSIYQAGSSGKCKIPINRAPTANAGPDQTITVSETASLNGTVSDDGLPAGSAVNTTWSKVSGPGTVNFGNPGVTVSTATFSAPGVYVLRLTATDSELTTSDDLTITVETGTCVDLPPGLVGWWPGDNHARDLMGGNNGALLGGATFTTAIANQGFKLDGVDDYVEIPDQASLKPANVTVEAWVRFDGLDSQFSGIAVPGYQYIVFKKNTRFYQHEGYTLVKRRFGNVDKISFAIASAEGVQVVADSQTTVVTGQFYHVAGTYDGSRVKLYINGVLEDEEVASFPLNYGSRPVFIGASGEEIHDGKLNGVVDEVGIFDRALVASQVLSIYLAGHEGKCKPPVNSAPTVSAGPDQTGSLPNGANSKLFVMNRDGSDQRRLTHSTANEIASSWSPDGTKILFASNREGNNELYVMDADGSRQTRLTYHPADDTDPFWSPDGTKITFISNREGPGALYMMDTDGSHVVRITHNQASEYSAAWQPRVVQGTRVNGDRIAFVSMRDGHPEIYVINPDGSNQTRLTNNPAGNEGPIWSPDGSQIAFSSLRDGNYQVYLMNADGSGQSRLTTGPAESFASDWSPDGMDISGGSRRDGNEEIYLTHIAGVGQTRLTNNPATDYVSFWSPDSRKIVFSSTREGVYLNGAASDDGLPSGLQLAVSWSQVSGPGQTTFSAPGAVNTLATFNLPGTYVLRLTASDGELSSTDDVIVIVSPVPTNQPPLVAAGQDQTLHLADTASLRGTVSDDGLPSSSRLSVAWSKVSGPGTVTFGNAGLPHTTASFSAEGTYMLRLAANDSELSGSDELTITVNALVNLPPVVNAGTDQAVSLPDKAVGVFINDLDGFNVAAGSPSVAVNFDSLPTGSDLSGTTLSGVKFERGNVPSPSAPLVVTRGADTFTPNTFSGIIDATTNKLIPTSGENVLSPGGAELAPGNNPLVENDDLKVTFDQPVSAVGFDILFQENDFFSAVGVSVLDPNGNVLYSNNSQPTGSGAGGGAPGGPVFFGFVSSRANIASIVIDEWDGDNNFPDSNIGFDTFRIARIIAGRAAVNLSGTISDDGLPVGGALTSVWSKASGPGAVTFDDPQQRITKATFSEPGTYVLRLTASDSQLTGSDELNVTVSEGVVNQAPTVNAGADQTVNQSDACQLGGTASDDGIPAGSNLSIAWSKVRGPGTVTFGNAGAAATSVTFSATGTYVLRLTASDSLLTSSDEVVITVTGNQAPVVNAGPDQTVTLPGTASINGTASDDGLPAGSTLSLTWNKVSGPGTVSVNNAHAASIIAAFSQPGTYVLRLTASDSQLSGSDDVTITVVAGNQAPTVNAGADLAISMPGTANLSGTVTDDGLPTGSSVSIAWSKVSGPGTVTFGNAQSAATTATFSVAGVYALRLTASDSQLSASDDVVVTVNGINQAPTVNAGPDQSITLPNTATLSGTVSDDGLPAGRQLIVSWSVVGGAGSVTFGNSSAAATTVSFSEAGTYVLRLAANDSDLTAQDEVSVTVYPATPPPTVGISSPADGSEITTRTEFIGSVSNGSYRLEYSLNTDDGSPAQTWIPFASGSGPITNGTLGTFDATQMLNGTYDVRLVATDAGGQTSVTQVTAVVAGQQKIGNFTISFKDLGVPLAGLPIEVVRTYDSRDKRVGDFGVGWTLGIKSVRLEKSGVLGRHWQETVSGGFLPDYCIQPSRPHIVTITFPDGKVYKFQAQTAQQCQRIAPITSTSLVFTPMPGTHGTLVVNGPSDVQVAGSIPGPVDLISFSNPDIFNSSLFHLTTENGTTFLIDQKGGVRKVTDTNGNTLMIDANGITHSSGQSISFVRDTEGRIKQINDPSGHPLLYHYDENGNLDSYTDAEGNVTTYAYVDNHYLQDITVTSSDGLQTFKPVINRYEDGRLAEQQDAYGKITYFDHDLVNRRETITDRLGHATIYEYDEEGNVVYTKDAEGGETSRSYDGNGNVLTETTAQGTTVNEYFPDDNLKQTTDPYGNVTRFTYNRLSQVKTITDAKNNLTVNNYDDASGNLLSSKDAEGNETRYSYNLNGQTRTVTQISNDDPTHTLVTTFDYYQNGYLKTQTDPLGNVTTYTYDANGNRKSQTVRRTLASGVTEDLTTSFEYDDLNRLVKTIYPDTSFTQVFYNLTGQQSSTKDQLSHETRYEYDDLGRLIKTIYADGKRDETKYDEEGRRILSIDRDDHTTRYDYDKTGRLKETLYPDGGKTTIKYDAAGRVLEQHRWLDATTKRTTTYRYEREGNNRVVYVTDPLNHTIKQVFDENGNLWKVTDANNHTTTYEYDKNNRRVKVIYPDTSFELTKYDGYGRVASKTDQASKVTEFKYDELGRMIKVVDAMLHETRYAYDEVGNQTAQTDANNHTTRYEYDKLGRRTKRTLPEGMSELFQYDAAGNLKRRTDFNQKTTAYDYDALNRLTAKTPDASFNQPGVSYTYTARGQRETMTDSSGLTTYGYDSRGRLLRKASAQGTLTYTYDKLGNLKTVRSSNPQGVTIDYSYDAASRLETVTDNRLPAGSQTTTYNYDEAGNLKGYVYPNGVRTSYDYNTLNRLTDVVASRSTTVIASYHYELGAAGNRRSVTELSGRKVTYAYDDLYRLTSETIEQDPQAANNGAVSYEYDAVGNRKTRTSTQPAINAQSFTYDKNDRVTTETYDNNGNTLVAGGVTYSFDWENRLQSVNGGAISYLYDGDGNRVEKRGGGVTISYLVDTNSLTGYAQVVDELVNGAVTRTYTYGHDLISQHQIMNNQWAVSYYGSDGHASTRYLTEASGAITDTYSYDAFGTLISQTGTTPNDYLYAGEQWDANSGFYYLRARYMNPSSGRFLSMDSFEGRSNDPLSLHKYLYSKVNPISNVDPSGNFATSTIEVSQAAAINAIVNAIAIIALNEIFNKIKEKLEEDSGLFIYRRGNPNSMKTTALYREDDWKSGLSFSTRRPKDKHLKFRVVNLLIAGFAVFPDGGRKFTNIIEGGPLDERIAGPDHVSVFLPDRSRWDAWYDAEKDNSTQNPFVPNSHETSALYALREFELPW